MVAQELIRREQKHSMRSDYARVPPFTILGALGKTYVSEVEPGLLFIFLCSSQMGLKAKVLCSINLEVLLFELVSIRNWFGSY